MFDVHVHYRESSLPLITSQRVVFCYLLCVVIFAVFSVHVHGIACNWSIEHWEWCPVFVGTLASVIVAYEGSSKSERMRTATVQVHTRACSFTPKISHKLLPKESRCLSIDALETWHNSRISFVWRRIISFILARRALYALYIKCNELNEVWNACFVLIQNRAFCPMC